MSSKTGNLRIAVYGVLLGLGMVAVALAVFTHLPIGKEFIRVLRQDSIGQSDARGETTPADQIPDGTKPGDSDKDRSPDSLDKDPTDQADEEFPLQITITSKIEVTMGMSRLIFEIGEMLTVSGRKKDLFLCDYLGDTVEIPIDATDWSGPGQVAP